MIGRQFKHAIEIPLGSKHATMQRWCKDYIGNDRWDSILTSTEKYASYVLRYTFMHSNDLVAFKLRFGV